jgi:hypothetical protein
MINGWINSAGIIRAGKSYLTGTVTGSTICLGAATGAAWDTSGGIAWIIAEVPALAAVSVVLTAAGIERPGKSGNAN